MKLAENYRIRKKISGNKIVIVRQNGIEEEVSAIPNLSVTYVGYNSLIVLHEPFYFNAKINMTIGENTFIEIGKNFKNIGTINLSTRALNVSIVIGENNCFDACSIQLCDENDLEFICGSNCIFANGTYIKVADGHTIFDVNSKKVLNKPSFGIHIGDHVWIARNASVLKDVEIPDNCIIGAGAMVTKKQFEPNSIIAGVPAKTIRTGVNWDPHKIFQYETLNPN